ncbi:MAG: hypothetical protein ACYTFK_02640 [Planctomycetota bacterium]|jgi:hypothetical protein
MKRYLVSIVVLLIVITAAWASAAKEEKPKSKRKAKSALSVQPPGAEAPEFSRRRRISSAEAREERRMERNEMARGLLHKEQLKKLDMQIEQKRSEHEKLVGELKAIKKLALEEKAAKTAERLANFIDIQTGLFDENIRQLESKRDNINQQVEKQAQDRLKRRERLMKIREEELKRRMPKADIQGRGKAESRSE